MKQLVVDEAHERFGQIAELENTVIMNGKLWMYYLRFDDGKLEGLLAYQIDSIKENVTPEEEQYSLDEKLAILYRSAWIDGLDGDKHMERWKLKAKELLELKDEA